MKRYNHLNAEFQIISRREKKDLSEHSKEVEENNRMGNTSDLFKKIRDTKGTFHAKMDTVKDRNGMDITVAEDIKKRWQKYREPLYKKGLNDQDNHKMGLNDPDNHLDDGVITLLEPDILECEVK